MGGSMDLDNDAVLTRDEFARLLNIPDAVKALSEVGVDVGGLLDMTDYIFQSDEQGQQFDNRLDFEEFMDLTLKLRGDTTATVRNIVDLQQLLHSQNTSRSLQLARLEE